MQLHRRTNHTAKDTFMRLVKDGWIRNCTVTPSDVKRAELIYGPPIPSIQGRTKNRTAPRMKELPEVLIPRGIYEDLKNVHLCVDFYYVNGITVFHSISKRINYRTVSFPDTRTRKSIAGEINSIKRQYHGRGFRIVDVYADNEFEKVRSDIYPIRIHCCGSDEHIPD